MTETKANPEAAPRPVPYLDPHLRAHRSHMRQIKFTQKRGHWIRLTQCLAKFHARKPDSLSRHEAEQFEAAKTELIELENLLDQMKLDAEAERQVEEDQHEARKALPDAKMGEDDVDPFHYQKIREKEHRAAMKK